MTSDIYKTYGIPVPGEEITRAKESAMYKRMISGKLYYAEVPELGVLSSYGRSLANLYNNTPATEHGKRQAILRALFGQIGQRFTIEPNLRVDYGCNIFIGENFYANVDCVFLDVAPIRIGDNCMLGPNVRLVTLSHPLDARVRASELELGLPITVGNNVWFGASVTVNPGVTIGDNVVIGSGAVVTKDIPANCIAVGNPARPLRFLDSSDSEVWERKAADFYAEFPSLKSE